MEKIKDLLIFNKILIQQMIENVGFPSELLKK